MCKQYAYLFEEYGFKTLQQVCQLQPTALRTMGIPLDHCDKILENVSVLRQSLVGSLNSGCSYPDYDHHLGSNPSSTGKFSYPSTGPFPSVAHSTSQYSGHNSQLHSNLPYSNSQAYSGSQGTQYVNQDVIYRMGHGPGSLASPSLPNRSPAHKPFSPPPFSPHGQPPPAHQQQNVSSYDFTGNQAAVSPSNHNPARPLASPSTSSSGPPSAALSVAGNSSGHNNASSDPLQSLQKMVMQEGQAVSSSDSFSPSCDASKSNFGSIDQLVGRESQSHSSECSSPASAVSQPVKASHSPAQDSESLHVQLSDTGSETNAPKDQKPTTDTDCLQSETQGDSQSSSSIGIVPACSPPAAKNDNLCTIATLCAPQESLVDQNGSVGSSEQQTCYNNGDELSELPVDTRTDVPADLSQDSMSNRSPRGRWKNSVEDNSQEVAPDTNFLPNTHYPSPNGTKSPPRILLEGQTLNGPTSNDNYHENTEQYQGTDPPPPVGGRGTKRNRRGTPRTPRQRNAPRRRSNSSELMGNDTQCHSNQIVDCSVDVHLLNTPTKLRGRRSSAAGQPETITHNHVVGDQTESATPSFDGQSPLDNQKYHSPTFRSSTKPSSAASTNSEGAVMNTPLSPSHAKPPRLELSSTPSRRGGKRSPEWRSRPANCLPLDATSASFSNLLHMSSDPSSMLDVNMQNAMATECTVNIKEEDTTACLNRLNDSFSSPGSSDSPSKRKRGRPLGSKNKPKSSGSEQPIKPQKKSHKKKLPLDTEASEDVEEQKKRRLEKGKKANPVEAKPRGPFIHIEPSPSGSMSVTVQNTPFREEEVDSRGFRKKKGAVREGRPSGLVGCTKRRMAKVGYTSTLSTKYDALTKDKTWVCELCHRGSHYNGLGDLFGPYFEDKRSCNIDDDKDREVSGMGDQSFRKGKRCKEISKDGSCEGDGAEKFASTSEADAAASSPKEIWIHEDCIVWSHGVYLVGNKVYGLEEATRVAADMVCSKCKETGATLGCLNKGCTEQYHYVCALERGCQLAENYSLVCSKHKKKPRQGT